MQAYRGSILHLLEDPTKTTNAAAAKQIAAQIAELKRNIDLSQEDLKKLENVWRDRLQSWHPLGLNTRDD